MLVSHLIPACENGADRRAREAMLLGATLAGQAFANAPVAAVHALAYPLGGHFHIPHGLSNALMLAPVLRFNADAAASHCGTGGRRRRGWNGRRHGAHGGVHHLPGDLMDRSGAPRRLRDVGVTQSSLPTLAADAMKQQRLLLNNPVVVTESDALRLYEQAY